MNLRNCSPALFVKNIEVSKNFYCDIPGLQIDLDFGKNIIFKNGFAIWEVSRTHIISEKLGFDEISKPGNNRFELYFETEDLRGIYRILKSKNIRFLHDIHEEPWGQRTIRFFDPDDHLIEIGESMAQFVCRFYNLGMTIDQISKRTSVPVEVVRKIVLPLAP